MERLKVLAIGLLLLGLIFWGSGQASADPVTVPLSDFVIFSGGGATRDIQSNFETWIGGHTYIIGNIGSNQDLQLNGGPVPGYPAQIDGSVYVGGFLLTGQYTIGTSLVPQEIVVNGATDDGAPANTYEADLGGLLYGNLFVTSELSTGLVVNLNNGILPSFGITGNVQITGAVPGTSCPDCTAARVGGTVTNPSTKTFALITMPAATDLTGFINTQGNQQVPSVPGFLTLAPNTIATGYGALTTSATNQTINLSSGSYYFESIDTDGGLTLNIDLTSGQCIKIYVLNDASFNLTTLKVKGAGTGGNFVSIDQAPGLAGLIYLETQGVFQLGPGGTDTKHIIWGGTVYASSRVEGEAYIDVRQYVEWYGAAWSYDSFNTLDHGYWQHVPLACDGQAKASKSGYKFNDLNKNNAWDKPGEPALPDWTIKLYDADQTTVLYTRITDADGFYEFADLEPGTYVVCETQQPNWTQTFPVAGAGVVNCLSGGLGYQFTLAAGQNHTDNNFGNFQTVPGPAIHVEKFISVDGVNGPWVDAHTPPGLVVPQGTDLFFKYVVKNTGNVPLTNVTLTDSVFDATSIPPFDPPAITNPLPAGDTYTYIYGPVAFEDLFSCSTDYLVWGKGTVSGPYPTVNWNRPAVHIGDGSKIYGNVGGWGDIDPNGAVEIWGDVDTRSQFMGPVTQVKGTLTQNNPSVDYVLPTPVIFIPAGQNYLNLANGFSLILGPGSYGRVQGGGGGKLYLRSGDYYFDSFQLANGTTFYMDLTNGPINIYVANQANFGADLDAVITSTVGDASDIFFEANWQGTGTKPFAFSAGGGSDWLGTVFTPNGGIHFGSGSGPTTFKGYFWSGWNGLTSTGAYAGLSVDIQHGVKGEPPPVKCPHVNTATVSATYDSQEVSDSDDVYAVGFQP